MINSIVIRLVWLSALLFHIQQQVLLCVSHKKIKVRRHAFCCQVTVIHVSMTELSIKGTPGVMMWVPNVVAISKPPKSDRWLSLVFDSLFCCITKCFIFLCHKQFCIRFRSSPVCCASQASSVYLCAQRRSC